MLTDEQLKEREWATRNIISSRPDGGKPYLFISYKSDDWNVVLNEIVRNMVNKYGIRVYYDRIFDSDNKVWCTNMMQAMESASCIGVLAFLSKKYMNSYACALELINTKTKRVYLSRKRFMDIIPIIVDENFKPINEMKGDYLKANILEWDDYDKILDNVISNKENLKKNNFNDFIDDIEKTKEKTQEVTFQDLADCVKDMLVGKTHDRRYLNIERFYEDLKSAIESIPDGKTVFDESLIGTCPKESDDKRNKQSSFDSQKHDDNTNINDDAAKSNIQNNNSDDNIYEVSSKDYNARYKIVGDSIIILKGSKINYSEKYSPKKIYQNLVDNHKINEDGILLDDVEPLPRSTAGGLIKGASTNGADLLDEKRKIK